MSKHAPDPPDYAGAAQQQAQSSREVTEQQTWANRPTINTPFGQQTWNVTPTWDPSTGQYLNNWTQNTYLTPETQSALNSQMRIQQGRSNLAEGMLGRVNQDFSQPMDWNSFTPMSLGPKGGQYGPESVQRNLDTNGLQGVNGSQDYYNDAGNAIYNQWASRNEPRMQQDTTNQRTQLYNMGLREGTEAYDREMKKLRESQTDARTQASYQATTGAGAEAQRMQGMDMGLRGQQFGERSQQGAFANSAANQVFNQRLAGGAQQFQEGSTAANFQNTVRQQQIAEQMQRRGMSLNEVNAVLNGQQVGMPSMPSFNTAQRSEPVQALQAAGQQQQANMDQFNAQQAGWQGLMSGGASMAMMFSDRRLKKNIEHIDERDDGLNVYEFHYIWQDDSEMKNIGCMADEVEKLYPEAVVDMHGYKAVDYGRI